MMIDDSSCVFFFPSFSKCEWSVSSSWHDMIHFRFLVLSYDICPSYDEKFGERRIWRDIAKQLGLRSSVVRIFASETWVAPRAVRTSFARVLSYAYVLYWIATRTASTKPVHNFNYFVSATTLDHGSLPNKTTKPFLPKSKSIGL